MKKAQYIHGTEAAEQHRLAQLNQLTNAAFVEFLDLRDATHVLEVGSGLGLLANAVATRLPHGEVVGLEYSDAQLAKAIPDANVRFQQGDAHDLPFPDGIFDVAYCRYVLEHVADPIQVLREMKRVLRPGGRVFAQENNILVNHFWPECPVFDRVWAQFVQLQSQLGGDALIGKKLYAYFREAGFREVTTSVAPEFHTAEMQTFVPWVTNLMGNVASAAEELTARGLASAEELRRCDAELHALMQQPHASAYFYWNRATGRA